MKKRQVTSLDLAICVSDIRDACVGLSIRKVKCIDKRRYLFKFKADRVAQTVLDRPNPLKESALEDHFDAPKIAPLASSRTGVFEMFLEVGVRVHLTTCQFETSEKESIIAKAIRNDLSGCTLKAVDQIFFDRVVKFTFQRQSTGEVVYFVVELYDKGNALLLDDQGKITFVFRKNVADGEAQRVDRQHYDEVYHNKLETKRDTMLSCTTIAPTTCEEKLACVVAAFVAAGQDVKTSLTFSCLAAGFDGALRPKKQANEFPLFLHLERLASEIPATSGERLKAIASIGNMGDVLAAYIVHVLPDVTPVELIPRLVDVICFMSLSTYLPFSGIVTPTSFQPNLPGVPLPPKAVECKDLPRAIDQFFSEEVVVAKKSGPAKGSVADKTEKVEKSIKDRVNQLKSEADANEEIGRIITIAENRDVVDNCINIVNGMLATNSYEQVKMMWEDDGDEDPYLSYISQMIPESSIIVLRLLDEEDEEREVEIYLNRGNAWKNAEFYYSQKKDNIEKVIKTEKRLPDALKNAAREKKVNKQAPAVKVSAKAPVTMQDIPMPTQDTLSRLGLEAPDAATLRFPLERRSELQLEKVFWFFTAPRSIEGLPGKTSFLVIRPRDKTQLAVFTDNAGRYLSHTDLWVYSDAHLPCIIKTSLVPSIDEKGIPVEVAQEAMVFTAAHGSVGKQMLRSPVGKVCWGKQVQKSTSQTDGDFIIAGNSAPVPPSADTDMGVGLYFTASNIPPRAEVAIATDTDSKYGSLDFSTPDAPMANAKPVLIETESKKAKATPQQVKQQDKKKESDQKAQSRRDRADLRKQKKEIKSMLANAGSDDDDDVDETRCQNRGEKLRHRMAKKLAESVAAESERGSMADMGEVASQARTEEYHKPEPINFNDDIARLVCSTAEMSELSIQFAVVCFAPLSSLRECKYKVRMDLIKSTKRGEVADAVLSTIKASVSSRHVGAPNGKDVPWAAEPYWVSYSEAKLLLSVNRDDVLKQLITHYAPTGNALMLPALQALEAPKSS